MQSDVQRRRGRSRSPKRDHLGREVVNEPTFSSKFRRIRNIGVDALGRVSEKVGEAVVTTADQLKEFDDRRTMVAQAQMHMKQKVSNNMQYAHINVQEIKKLAAAQKAILKENKRLEKLLNDINHIQDSRQQAIDLYAAAHQAYQIRMHELQEGIDQKNKLEMSKSVSNAALRNLSTTLANKVVDLKHRHANYHNANYEQHKIDGRMLQDLKLILDSNAVTLPIRRHYEWQIPKKVDMKSVNAKDLQSDYEKRAANFYRNRKFSSLK